MPKIKNYLRTLPALLFSISGALLVTFFLVNFLIYRYSAEAFFSSVQVSVAKEENGSSLALVFNIAKNDQENFKNISELLGINLTGEKIEFHVNENLGERLNSFNNQIVNFKPTAKSILFNSKLGGTSKEDRNLWQYADQVPEDTVFYLENQNPFWGLPKEISFLFGNSGGVVAVFPDGKSSSIVWLKNNPNAKNLEDSSDKLIATQPETASSSAAIERVVIEKLPIKKLTIREKSYYFGKINDTLAASSSEEGFRALISVKNNAKNSLSANRYFNLGNYQISSVGSAALFIGNTDRLNIFTATDQNLRELFILSGSSRENLKKYLDKITGFNLVLSGTNNSEGMVNFR